MKKKNRLVLVALFFVIIIAVLGLTLVKGERSFKDTEYLLAKGFYPKSVPPNKEAISKMLIEKGKLSKDSDSKEIERVVNDYVKNKSSDVDVKKAKEDIVNAIDNDKELNSAKEKIGEKAEQKDIVKSLAKEENTLREVEKDNKNIDNDTYKKYDSSIQAREEETKNFTKRAKALVLLVEFGNDEKASGPVHNMIEKPADPYSQVWVRDFSKQYYKDMLFKIGGFDLDINGQKKRLFSMREYFRNQSNGNYDIDGDVYGWFKVSHSEKYYGDDIPNENGSNGADRLEPGTPLDLVKELLELARNSVSYENYDIEDPEDLDHDGNLNEPDGVIDNLIIVHAGIDQAAGGGEQGDDAIWSHSAPTLIKIPSKNPKVNYWGENIVVNRYTMQSENGGVGLFCHEFAHALGLPDDYDTQYTGLGEPVGNYSLMGSGSWAGRPVMTMPVGLSPWARMVLGKKHGGEWIKTKELNFEDITEEKKTFKLDMSTMAGSDVQALKINLPDYKFELAKPAEGQKDWYSGKANEMNAYMKKRISLPLAEKTLLSLKINYETEDGWDFAFVQISDDNEHTFKSLSSSRTVSKGKTTDETIIGNLPGYTGSSNGWLEDSFDISNYNGKDIVLKLSYITDKALAKTGVFFDDVKIISDNKVIFEDGAEDSKSNWELKDFSLNEGYLMKSHCYIAEWRTYNGVDEGLKYLYSVDANGNFKYYQYEDGMLLWYRNFGYEDNWVGMHPGYGFIGVVDSHQKPVTIMGRPIFTQFQIHDAPFSTKSVGEKLFYLGNYKVYYPGSNKQPLFDDSLPYWDSTFPHSGLKLLNYGLNIRVEDSSDYNGSGVVTVFVK